MNTQTEPIHEYETILHGQRVTVRKYPIKNTSTSGEVFPISAQPVHQHLQMSSK